MRTLLQHELFFAGIVFVIGMTVLIYELMQAAI